MKKNESIHFTGLDIVRIVATLLVLAVHFFLNTYYYKTDMIGTNMKLQSVVRNFCMSCVPLFMMLSGYLGNKKEYNLNFFKKLFEILIIWLFYSFIEFWIIGSINNTLDDFSLKKLLFNLTNFQACRYSWYIEMYIGLYLLSPIINIAYDSFDNTNKNIFVCISIFLTFIPIFVNDILSEIFLLPDYWIILYPFAYYIVGKYIYDKQFNFNKIYILILLILTQLLTFYLSNIMIIDHDSLSIFIQSILLFLLLYNINIKVKWISNTIRYLANISLDIYLASSLIDLIIYPLFLKHFNLYTQQMLIYYAPVIVSIIFVISVIYGSIRKFIIRIR